MANKQARILTKKIIDGVEYKPNQVIDADAALIKQLVKDGIACDDAKSVKYCLDEGEAPIAHQAPASEKLTKAQAKAQAEEAARLKGEAITALEAELVRLNTELTAAADANADTETIVAQIEAKQAELDALLA